MKTPLVYSENDLLEMGFDCRNHFLIEIIEPQGEENIDPKNFNFLVVAKNTHSIKEILVMPRTNNNEENYLFKLLFIEGGSHVESTELIYSNENFVIGFGATKEKALSVAGKNLNEKIIPYLQKWSLLSEFSIK